MDDELPTEGGVATRILDGRFSGSEYMITSLTVPRDAAEPVDYKTYLSIKKLYF